MSEAVDGQRSNIDVDIDIVEEIKKLPSGHAHAVTARRVESVIAVVRETGRSNA